MVKTQMMHNSATIREFGRMLTSLLGSRAGRVLVLLGLLTGLAGCSRQDIQIYQVPKETARSEASAASGNADGASEPKPSLTWKLPAGWEEVAPGEMRLASFRVKGDNSKLADVSIVPLPGLAGRDLDNVNRWRGQLGLPAVNEAEMAKLAQPVDVAGQTGQLFEQSGKATGSDDPTRILAVVMRREGTAWFFKMTGDDSLVAAQKAAFIGFLKSLNFQAAAAQPDMPASHPPVDAGSIASAKATAAAGVDPGKPTWEVPAGWKEVPGGQFLVAKFALTGDAGAQAAVNISMSAGDGGGLAANVNRWRGQLGLSPFSAAELAKEVQTLELPGGKAMFVEMNGTDARTGQPARLVGAIVPNGAQTWFYKLMGNETIVEREKKAFTKFVETAKY